MNKIKRTWLMTPEIGQIFDKTKPHAVSVKGFFGANCCVHVLDVDGPGTHPKDVCKAVITITPTPGVEFNYEIPVSDASQITAKIPTIHMSRAGVGNDFTLEIFHDALEGLFLMHKEYDTQEEADNDTWPGDWFGVDVSGHRTFVESNLIGKRWDSNIGLIIDSGPMTAFGGEPFPPMTEYQIITGDGDDLMPTPLIIP